MLIHNHAMGLSLYWGDPATTLPRYLLMGLLGRKGDFWLWRMEDKNKKNPPQPPPTETKTKNHLRARITQSLEDGIPRAQTSPNHFWKRNLLTVLGSPWRTSRCCSGDKRSNRWAGLLGVVGLLHNSHLFYLEREFHGQNFTDFSFFRWLVWLLDTVPETLLRTWPRRPPS